MRSVTNSLLFSLFFFPLFVFFFIFVHLPCVKKGNLLFITILLLFKIVLGGQSDPTGITFGVERAQVNGFDAVGQVWTISMVVTTAVNSDEKDVIISTTNNLCPTGITCGSPINNCAGSNCSTTPAFVAKDSVVVCTCLRTLLAADITAGQVTGSVSMR